MKNNFVHLHVHTDYSLDKGMIKIDELVNQIKKLNMNAVAITDHGNLYGAIEFYKECKRNNIKPIIGSEFYFIPFSGIKKSNNIYNIILLAKNQTGYKNLIQLSSESYKNGYYNKPRINKKLLEAYNEGLICLSVCLKGDISDLIIKGKKAEAENKALYYKKLFGDDSFFFELQIHGLKEETKIVKALVEISKKLQIPFVATNNVYYLNKEDAELHDILLCIKENKTLNDISREKNNSDEFYFKSEYEMFKIFKEIPDALTNTQKIAEMCNLEINLPGTQLPDISIPADYTQESYLKKIATEGLKKRYNTINFELTDRLNKELEIINKKKYTGYFLIIWDIIQFAIKNNIRTGPIRGNGSGSLAAYLL